MLGLGRLGLGLARTSKRLRSDLRAPAMAKRSEVSGSAGFMSSGAGGSMPRAGPQLPSSAASKGARGSCAFMQLSTVPGNASASRAGSVRIMH